MREPMPDAEPLLTPAEVSALYKVDVKTCTRWAVAGKLHSIRTLGNHRRFYANEVYALLRGETYEPAGGWPKGPDPLDAPVYALWGAGKGALVHGRLKKNGIASIRDLTAASADDLRRFGLRPPQVDEVRLVLHRKGLALHGEVADTAA